MERRSIKHGPRLDEQMDREVSGSMKGTAGSRAEEWREAEPAGEDQPELTTVPHSASGDWRTGTPQGMTPQDVERRSRLARVLNVSALPGDRETLLRNAQENEAPDDIVADLRRLPSGTLFENVAEVWAALGHTNEHQRW